jgi:hypothetical protein
VIYKYGKKKRKSSRGEWDRTPGPRCTQEEATAFWEWLLQANGIPERDFFKELKRDDNPVRALEKLFAKMNELAAMRQMKLGRAGKGRR